MLKRYFCSGLVALALLGGCGEKYTTTDTATTRTETRVEDNRGSSVDASARGHQQPDQPGATSVSVDTAANNSSAPNSGDHDMGAADTTPAAGGEASTPATYGQSIEDRQIAENKSASTLNVEDGHFVTEAAKGGMKEVALGRIASEKASSAEVKQFGKTMVEDHSQANEELKSLAQQQGFTLPGAIARQADQHADLSRLSGAAFDKRYAEMMVKDHEKTVALFEKEADRGQNAELRKWASEKLPTLKHHLQMSRDMLDALKS